MLTKDELENTLNSYKEIVDRVCTLKLAEKLNPEFRTPQIIGGYLRNIYFGVEPKDCDVVFQGNQLNQPGVLEAVMEAERQLGIKPYPNWEFENATATGITDEFFENTLGKYSHHTDYLTLLSMDSDGHLHLGDDKTLHDFENKIYDLRFSGIEIWEKHRGNGRSYLSCLVGDLTRGLYLGKVLGLEHSAIAAFLTKRFDSFYNELGHEDQDARQAFWLKKTKGDPSYQSILDKFGVTVLKTKKRKSLV